MDCLFTTAVLHVWRRCSLLPPLFSFWVSSACRHRGLIYRPCGCFCSPVDALQEYKTISSPNIPAVQPLRCCFRLTRPVCCVMHRGYRSSSKLSVEGILICIKNQNEMCGSTETIVLNVLLQTTTTTTQTAECRNTHSSFFHINKTCWKP